MASEILGLFTSPEQYRAMQGQQTQNEALQYAALNPFQRADVSLYTGGKQLGQATGRLFGVEDPQLKKITMRQQMISGAGGGPRINLNDPESMRRAAVIAQEQDDPEFAMFLAKKADEIQLSQANVQAKLRERPANVDKSIQVAQTRADLNQQIARLEREQIGAFSQERADAIAYLKDTLAGLPLKTEGLVREQQIARDLALAAGPEGSEAYSAAYTKGLRDLTNKTTQEKLGEFERVLNARYPDTPENADKRAQLMDQFLTSEITGRKSGKGTQVDIGGIRVDTGKAGEAAGKKLGEELIDVKGKQAAIDSIRDAKALLGPNGEGVYAGAYGPTKQFVAKFTGVGSTEKAARTEEFLAYIGETVVPRLKEFGGNDSEQELAYLNKITGGDITMEPKALVRILETAERKIQRGIDRLRKQAETGETKKPLTSLLPRAGDNANRPSEPVMVMPGPATPAPTPAVAAPKAPAKGKTQTRTLKSGKKVTVEMD